MEGDNSLEDIEFDGGGVVDVVVAIVDESGCYSEVTEDVGVKIEGVACGALDERSFRRSVIEKGGGVDGEVGDDHLEHALSKVALEAGVSDGDVI